MSRIGFALLASSCWFGCTNTLPEVGGTGGSRATGGGTPSGGVGAASGGRAGTEAPPGTGGDQPGSGGNAGFPNGGTGMGNGGFAASGGRGGTTGAAGVGGLASGGSAAGGAAPIASFLIGADITFVQADEARGATYSDGTPRDILQLLKDHGFNAIRLRTFVDPRAADGYDKTNGYADLAHTITFGKRVKAAGMAFLLDFHYSDNWADPGRQCVPVAWQQFTTIPALATAVHDYTKDAITQLVAAGARPDLVQVGNEITPGMLIHLCNSTGTPMGDHVVTGSISNWTNLGALLKAGVAGIKEVDPTIKIMLHIDRGGSFTASRDFIRNAMAQGVAFDVFGESCYTVYQGLPAGWMSTFTQLAAAYPNLKLVVAEYGPEQRAANDIVFNLPAQQGLGTFNWEPTRTGIWNTGHTLFSPAGNRYTAAPDLALYDLMKAAYAGRL